MNGLGTSEKRISDMHRDMKEEILFFHRAACGDIYAIRQNIAERRFRDGSGVGSLSTDPVLNLKYHMVITAGILSRVCIEHGLTPEESLKKSDHYIQKLDYAKTEDAVEKIHDEMILDYTSSMQKILYKKHFSRSVDSCIDYIYAHINERITLKDLTTHTGVSSTFLSRVFSEEMGMPIGDFIRDKKIEKAKDLLVNSDLSILDISCQLSFSSQSHFIQTFKKITGTTPKQFRTSNPERKWVVMGDHHERERYPYLFE